MQRRRVLFFGLDGYDPEIGASLIEQGKLPTLARLLRSGLRYDLEHGAARRTGLAWEHISTGLTPEAAERFASIRLDTRTYNVRQWPSEQPPFAARLEVPTLVFNAPYFDLAASPNSKGIVGWTSHDPGMALTAMPRTLLDEAKARFGEYPAGAWTYALSWPSEDRTRRMGEALLAGMEHRQRVARWLFAERITDWQLGYLVCSELHSAVESMMHGWLADHPLAQHPSAPAARLALVACYESLDRFVATMEAALPEVTLALMVPHGMGPNMADLPGMLLMPELMHREFAGRAVFKSRSDWRASEVPLLADEACDWNREIRSRSKLPPSARRWWRQRKARFAHSYLGRRLGLGRRGDLRRDGWSVDWMPCAWYRDSWPKMDAFAVPAYYDAQVRVNLAGRERRGRVALADYGDVLDRVERTLAECRDWRSGAPLRFSAHRRGGSDPLALAPTDSDLVIDLQEVSLGWRHPRLGLIGPAPMRRTGGHTGGHGLLLAVGEGIAPGHGGLASTFDVTPTVIALLGQPVPAGLSGRPLLLQRAA